MSKSPAVSDTLPRRASSDAGAGAFSGYRIVTAPRDLPEDLANHVMAFWEQQGAVKDATERRRRISELVCLIFDQDNNLAGVSTAAPGRLRPQGPLLQMMRMYIRPDARIPGLGVRALATSVQVVRDLATQHPDGARGVALLVENPRLRGRVAQRLLGPVGFVYLGRGKLGHDVWRLLFDQTGTAVPSPT